MSRVLRSFAPVLLGVLAGSAGLATGLGAAKEAVILHVSYDVTCELYQDVNAAFATAWKARTGETVTIRQSHGGSSKQVRSVLDGLQADVVSMNQALDIDQLHTRRGLIPKDWASRLPHGSVPSTSTFAQRGIGDVLLTFENEVHLTRRESGDDQFDVVVPSVSILAENPVVWVDQVVAKRGTTDVARAYLEYLFTEAGQELVARHHFRPRDPAILARYPDRFKALELFTVAEVFGDWETVQKTHFTDGGLYDQIYQKRW